MPSAQFLRLPAAKQEKVTAALFREFTSHSLADAQVARIVKDAGIARGAFYNYFTDLKDAYAYLFAHEMKQIHQSLLSNPKHQLSATDHLRQTTNFLKSVNQQRLRQLLIFHYQTNAGLLRQNKDQQQWLPEQEETPRQWAIKTLVHQAISEAIQNPAVEEKVLQKLKKSLVLLEGEG
ncbi:TetR/AcrR family transcriptional regulator [uncultured Limosilactobacillus sp.]|uniref:TetR/AcrR family transcriptional regulator n=1 Tax=uncultured Limosilactobacillus sp. TaxID=2837629 RepID=UPI0025E31DC3|nr:TetR/AcrR family transcriptional regulator [uncultured Limosilactobacillus sp.]